MQSYYKFSYCANFQIRNGMYQEKYVKNTAQMHTGSVCTLMAESDSLLTGQPS